MLELQNETKMHKREFKMRSTYITKKRRRLMQVEWKWCNRLSWDNFRHKLYMARTFGSRHHSPPYSILCASLWGLHPNVTFPQDSKWGVPKLGLLLSQNFGCLYIFQIFFLKSVRTSFITFENIFPTMYNTF